MRIGGFTIRHYQSGCVVSHLDGVRGVCGDFSLTPQNRQRKALNTCVTKLIRHYGPKDFLERIGTQEKDKKGGRHK